MSDSAGATARLDITALEQKVKAIYRDVALDPHGEFHSDLARLQPGGTNLELGSGSGTDSVIAAGVVGKGGTVIGVDMTDKQLVKGERLRTAGEFTYVFFRTSHGNAFTRRAAATLSASAPC